MNLDVPTEREETLDVDDATAFMHQQERVDDDLAGKKSHRYMGPYGECILYVSHVGPKKYQKIARMYDRTGKSTKCTLKKTTFSDLPTRIPTFSDLLLRP